MGDVGLARYKPALLPPCPTIRVLNYSNCQIHPLHLVVNFQRFSTLLLGFCSEASVHTSSIAGSPKCDTQFLWRHVVMLFSLIVLLKCMICAWGIATFVIYFYFQFQDGAQFPRLGRWSGRNNRLRSKTAWLNIVYGNFGNKRSGDLTCRN